MVILAQAKTLPFEISQDTKGINEETRMRYRYLDLRSERMLSHLVIRHKVIKFIRDYLDKEGFLEIETPYITKATPEGARDYLIPARLHPGMFYALPQSPQQFKQLLMVAGIEKYFQIARCFRDEDPRGDRQPEFTQLDLEMSFVAQNDILELYETLLIKMHRELFPEKKITKVPFPRIPYAEAIEKYKTDKPDLRKDKSDSDELAFTWIIDWPMFSYDKKEKRWDPHHHIFTRPLDEDVLLLDKDPSQVRSWQHDLVLNGFEIAGGSLRTTDPVVQEKVLELVGISKIVARERFGHMLEAFEYGVPPHGGIAHGLDRFCMILTNEDSIREVIAFPKTGDGRDLMMDAPSTIDDSQLKELNIIIKSPLKK
ncbi:MAG: aspS [Candidatus Berkelbacteria bacterium]|nr:aspS [Candidatus Berkelbacteria bacterium]